MKSKTPSHIKSVRVERPASAAAERLRASDRALIERHQAALRLIDKMSSAQCGTAVIRDFVTSRGPRTGTHPMATERSEPRPRPMATYPDRYSLAAMTVSAGIVALSVLCAVWLAWK